MPQLDLIIFFPQMFWLIFVFLFLYAFLLREYNPMILSNKLLEFVSLQTI